ncbi:MAG TPA: hypothetical protein VFU47_12695, partial [Armatimonadota bacterium]|nr:hypothetical protein [Armatimonadota bacterium]
MLLALPLLAGSAAHGAARQDMKGQCAALAEKWKARLAAEHMNWVSAPPFVIAGDGTPQQLARYRDGTILAAARALRSTYFRKEPERPILILLFETEAPYRRLAKRWFGDEDVSPFGYYRRSE